MKNKLSKTKKNGIDEITSPICRKDCKVCTSGHIKNIHEMKKSGRTYDEIVSALKTDLNYSISKASLCRHFTNYKKHLSVLSSEMMNNDIIEEASKIAIHQKKSIALIDKVFAKIEASLDNNIIVPDISDLEKLVKIRYQLLSGSVDDDDSDVIAIAQKAFDKYGSGQQTIFVSKKNR